MCFPHTIPRNAAPLPCQPASLAATPPFYPKEPQAVTGSEAVDEAWRRSDSEAANLWNCKAACLPACLPGLSSCRDQPGQSQTQPSPCRSKAVLSFVGCQVSLKALPKSHSEEKTRYFQASLGPLILNPHASSPLPLQCL